MGIEEAGDSGCVRRRVQIWVGEHVIAQIDSDDPVWSSAYATFMKRRLPFTTITNQPLLEPMPESVSEPVTEPESGALPVTGLDFGRELRRFRAAAGLTLRSLAERVAFDFSYLAQVERGERGGSQRLARQCDRTLDTGGQLVRLFADRQTPHSRSQRSRRPRRPRHEERTRLHHTEDTEDTEDTDRSEDAGGMAPP